MSKITCKTTKLFREKNLFEVLKLLSQDFSSYKEKVILLVGASVEELISIRLLAMRNGLDDYKFIGVNNDSLQVQRFYSFRRIENVTISHEFERDFRGISEDDVNRGFVLLPKDEDMYGKTFYIPNLFFRNVSMIQGDILEGMVFEGIKVDAVICNNLLVHFEDQEKRCAIEEMLEYLSEGGFFARDACNTGYSWELATQNPNERIEKVLTDHFGNSLERISDTQENIYRVL